LDDTTKKEKNPAYGIMNTIKNDIGKILLMGELKLAMCMFRFLFKITLSLSEDVEYHVNYKGIESIVKIKTIKGANISSYTGEDYSWVTKIEDNLIIARVRDKSEDIPQKYIKYYENQHHFSGGVIEPTNFSIFEVVLTIPNKEILDKIENVEELKRTAFAIINYSINAYRLIFQESDIPLPKFSDSPVIEIWFSESVQEDNGFISYNFFPYTQDYNFKKFKKRNKNVFIDDKRKLFSEFISDGRDITLYHELMLDAIEQGEISNKYELAVLKIGTAFEIFMQGLLVDTCEILKIEKLQAGRDTKHFKLAIQEGSLIEDLLKKYLKTIVGDNSILSVKEYNYWHSRAYSIRNEIVHNGRTNVSENEAIKAFEATNNLVSLITKKVNEVLQKGTHL
jgi:hypothetical protein